MLLAIAILLGIHFILSIIKKGDVDTFPTTALVIVLWEMCFPLAIIVLCITALIAIIFLIND